MSAPLPSRWLCTKSSFFTGERMTGGPPLNRILTCAGPVMGDAEGNGHVCETCTEFVPGVPAEWKKQEDPPAHFSEQQCCARHHRFFYGRCVLKDGHEGSHFVATRKGLGYRFQDDAAMKPGYSMGISFKNVRKKA